MHQISITIRSMKTIFFNNQELYELDWDNEST